MTLRNLALPVKVLYTCIMLTLGTGYFFAITYLFMSSIEPHTREGDSVLQAVMEKYYGRRDVTAMESALEGEMGGWVTPEEKAKLLKWIHNGATEADYPTVEPIIQENCAACHNHDDMPGAPMTAFAEVAAFTQQDTGVSVQRLVRVSHIHVFGLTFIFTIISGIFVQSEAKSSWRAVLVAIPFLAIWADVGGWWFTHFNPTFASTVIVGGALAGLSLGVQIFLSLYEMWLLPSTNGATPGGWVAPPMPYAAAAPPAGPAAPQPAPPPQPQPQAQAQTHASVGAAHEHDGAPNRADDVGRHGSGI